MSDDERTLFVAGFNDDRVTEEILYELFLQAGPLEKVVIPKDKQGIPRRFAFVTFQHAVSVQYAKEVMEGIRLFGRTLNLQNRGGGGNESPRNSPASSPRHFNPDPQNLRPPPNYNRSNTWNGRDSERSPNQRPNNYSPQPELTNPYAQGKNYMSMDVLRGQAPTNNLNMQSMQPREHDSTDARRQRILHQQEMSINMHSQGHQRNRSNDRFMNRSDDRGYNNHDRNHRNRNVHPYGGDKRRRH
ncbi:hypothetical protein SNE40_017135 [Patella caerulea]|uniref:RRM domain-containing protein n=1 Tax=Patella caerulea TaxID=87958 RepID=A0AAN8PPM2_PATCE